MPQPPFSGSQIQISQRNGANDPVYRREDAKIAGLKDGGFIAVWAQYITADTQAASTSIQAQIYNANGTKRGAEFKVNTSSSSNDLDVHSPDVTVLTNGQILIAYEQRLNPLFTDKSDIRTRIFQPDGTPASPMVDAFPVTFHGASQYQPNVFAMTDDRYGVFLRDTPRTGLIRSASVGPRNGS